MSSIDIHPALSSNRRRLAEACIQTAAQLEGVVAQLNAGANLTDPHELAANANLVGETIDAVRARLDSRIAALFAAVAMECSK